MTEQEAKEILRPKGSINPGTITYMTTDKAVEKFNVTARKIHFDSQMRKRTNPFGEADVRKKRDVSEYTPDEPKKRANPFDPNPVRKRLDISEMVPEPAKIKPKLKVSLANLPKKQKKPKRKEKKGDAAIPLVRPKRIGKKGKKDK